jgi:hypothetical protein
MGNCEFHRAPEGNQQLFSVQLAIGVGTQLEGVQAAGELTNISRGS